MHSQMLSWATLAKPGGGDTIATVGILGTCSHSQITILPGTIDSKVVRHRGFNAATGGDVR